ncbi:hypothetical protein [Pseudorhodoplanes sp.]|uniref:hypothetical protein n=1 Tax=Pseudorhodoplanes sp. TaxID=1934341 RepID=UPI002BB6A84F|nr:hypothetical protein [Pseudorhodoplanes sp.]HWV44090.1 hypothetical protein [Pseudorhodoplanes sp.]
MIFAAACFLLLCSYGLAVVFGVAIEDDKCPEGLPLWVFLLGMVFAAFGFLLLRAAA